MLLLEAVSLKGVKDVCVKLPHHHVVLLQVMDIRAILTEGLSDDDSQRFGLEPIEDSSEHGLELRQHLVK